ncbi:dienelactone hydrolase family protein [Halocola ammonii]
MKNLLYLFTVTCCFAISLSAGAQSCCDMSATSQFAALSDDDSFKTSHLEPEDFVLQDRMGEDITFECADGKDGMAYFIESEEPSDKYLFVFQEWWGLNDHIREKAEKYYKDLDNVNVMCLDLYDGKTTTDREKAGELMQNADEKRIRTIIEGAIDHVGADAEVATLGWCFGGGWSLQATIILEEQAAGCVVYYGMPEKDMSRIEEIETEVLGIFAKKDGWITPEVVGNFEEKMEEAGKSLTVHFFDADHAFANPSNPVYDKEATEEAYDLSISFLQSQFE